MIKMVTRPFYLFIIFIQAFAFVECHPEADAPSAARCLDEAEAALDYDSIRKGEKLLRKAVQMAEADGDWHTCYIASQRLAEVLSQGNPEEALRLMKKALAFYEQHPDDDRNYVILLDYAGTYAAQTAFLVGSASGSLEGDAQGNQPSAKSARSYGEALDFINRAYNIAEKHQMTDLMCQTLTSLANIAWAREDFRQALALARRADSVATANLRPGVLQVLARSYLSLDMPDSAEKAYRQIAPGNDVHLAYIVQSNLAKIALRRLGASEVEDSVEEAFGQIEDIYYKALEQKDQYYQETLRQEMENQQLAYRSRMYGRTLLTVIVAAAIILLAVVQVLRYRIRMQEQEQRRLRQEAAHQNTLLHQANEVVSFLQGFILERTEVLKKLNRGGDSLITLSQYEWSEIERTLNAIDDNSFARIRERHPTMQEDDIRLCILTRLGLSNRTIGNIYCITVSAVQHRKLKLKKEVFGVSSPDVTLEQILRSEGRSG